MAQINFDASGVEPAVPMELLPPGKYRVQVVQSEMQATKQGDGQLLWLELDILDGPHRGRKLWDRLNLVNRSQQTVEIAQRQLSAICHAVDRKDRLFTDIAYDVPVLDMIQQGYLCPVVPKQTETQLDVGGVGTRGGEFIAKDLEAAVDRDEVTRAAVEEIVRHGDGRGSWLVFCSGVAHARHVRDAIREHDVSAETVTGDTPAPERDRILTAFKAGRLRCVTNANVLTTGFDAPGVDLIALLRPTKSVGLYVQMVGRGTRIAEGKEDCLVLDFAGNTARHGPIDTVDGRKKEPAGDGEAPIKVCPECQTINHASARHCIECDHEFPPPVVKVSAKAASNALLSTQIQATWSDVTGVTYTRHEKPGKPASLRVTYDCGLARHSEWVCLEHSGFPREKAVGWWQRRAPGVPAPASVEQALQHLEALRAPAAIQVRPVGQYTEIISMRFE